jgi:hypothetical protein
MKIVIRIDSTDNAAFQPDPTLEVVRILEELTKRIMDHGLPQDFTLLKDINGNTVGRAYLGRS